MIPITVGEHSANGHGLNPNEYQCLFCRNLENFEMHDEKPKLS
jgi:hypothetical protein